ncbi:hypothetical protein EI94DRAFT_1829840 [Lactarius quietus]|nr:hypothetical protein EI94DRAFT_1829840 [Lactarius quietus]
MYSSSETSINYKAILEAALSDYKKKTGTELLDNPLATEAQRCDTVDAALTILQDQAKAFPQSKDGDQRLMEQIGPLAKVLFSFSETLAFRNVGLALHPVKGIIAGISVLLAVRFLALVQFSVEPV